MILALRRHYGEALKGIPKPCWILAFAAFINRAGTMVLPFLALYLHKKLGYSVADAGKVVATYGIGGIVGSILGGRICDHLDPVRVQAAALTATAIGFVALGEVRSPEAIFAVVLLVSVFGEVMRPANHHATAIFAPAAVRQKAFTLNRLAVNLGMMIGPVAGGFIAKVGYRSLFVIDAMTSLLAGLLLWITLGREQHASAHREATSDGRPHRSPYQDGLFWAVMLAAFLVAMIFFQINATYTLYLSQYYNFTEDRIGLVLAPNTVMIVLFEIVVVAWARRFDRMKVIAAGCALIGGGFALVPFGRGIPWAILTVIIWTFGEMLSLSLMAGWVADRADPAVRGRYLGIYTAAFSVAYAAAPRFGTLIYGAGRPDWVFYGCGGLGAFLWLWLNGLARLPHHDRGTADTVLAAGSGTEASAVDPAHPIVREDETIAATPGGSVSVARAAPADATPENSRDPKNRSESSKAADPGQL